MSIDINSLQTFTDAEMVTILRWCIANSSFGQTRTINGRSISFGTMDQVMKTLAYFEDKAAAASGDDGTALIRFNETS